MVEQQVWLGVADELREITRHLAVGDFDPGNINIVVHVTLQDLGGSSPGSWASSLKQSDAPYRLL
jgi:hypothetical protein